MNWFLWVLAGLFAAATVSNLIEVAEAPKVRKPTKASTMAICAVIDALLLMGVLIHGGVL